ncbi:MAG TPA: hypothetical protein VMG41_05995 [Gemmatimonadales bacterium]|nr:hypothetical protein [Gemmatimonadales bacterium]
MRRVLLTVLLGAFALGCSDSTMQDPTAPLPAVRAEPVDLSLNPTAQIRLQILQLFPLGGGLIIAQTAFEVVVVQVATHQTAKAQATAQQLINFATKQFDAGVLYGGKSAGTLTKLTNLVNALEAYVGLPQAIPQGATDGVAAVVSPTQSGSSSITTPSGRAGVVVNDTDVNVPTLVTVYAVPETLLTNLPKYGPYYQFTSSSGTFNGAVLAGICTDAPDTVPNLRLAHNVPDPNPMQIQVLPFQPLPEGFLPCTPYMIGMGVSDPNENFAMRGLHALGQEISRLFSPTPLLAAASGTGVGGTTKNFSTFGVVQTGFDWEQTGWYYKPLGTYPNVPDTGTIRSQAVTAALSSYADTGTAAFSVGNDCGYSATSNNSTAYPLSSIVAFRRDFVLPAGALSGTMHFAIDNDFKVYLNGTDVTQNVTHSNTDQGYTSGLGFFEPGFWSHDNCAGRGDFALSMSGLDSVKNTVTIIAVDRGGSTYFDASVDH